MCLSGDLKAIKDKLIHGISNASRALLTRVDTLMIGTTMLVGVLKIRGDGRHGGRGSVFQHMTTLTERLSLSGDNVNTK